MKLLVFYLLLYVTFCNYRAMNYMMRVFIIQGKKKMPLLNKLAKLDYEHTITIGGFIIAAMILITVLLGLICDIRMLFAFKLPFTLIGGFSLAYSIVLPNLLKKKTKKKKTEFKLVSKEKGTLMLALRLAIYGYAAYAYWELAQVAT